MNNMTGISRKAVYNIFTAIKNATSGARRRVEIEHGNEEKTSLKSYDRLQAVALGRDLERNNCKAIALIEQIKTLAFATCKAEINLPGYEDWTKAAKRDFNQIFTRDCMYKYRLNFQEFVQLIESAKIREGDILISFDDWLDDSGKLLVWEADQIANIKKSDWENRDINDKYGYSENGVWKAYKQYSGVVLDEFGRVVAYNVTNLNLAPDNPKGQGVIEIEAANAVTIPAEKAILTQNRYRIGQYRGTPSILPISEMLSDIDEMIKSELMAAKTAAQWVAFIKKANENLSETEQDTLAGIVEKMGFGKAEDSEESEAAPDSDKGFAELAEKDAEKNQKLISGGGGLMEYLDPGEDVTNNNFNRPNLNTTEFYNFSGDVAGGSLGLAQGYSRMAVNSSYTSHRGETSLTYRHLAKRQKNAEWDYLDKILQARVEWAARHGLIPAPPVEDWYLSAFWIFPGMDYINPEAEVNADAASAKLGKKTLKTIIGADWKEKIDDTAEVIEYARKQGVPLSILETVAGAQIKKEIQE